MQNNSPTPRKAFTLIELLIVVAIIAILAAIAVPNFMEAQVRSKISRSKSDMRSLATSLEAYYVDSNAYPSCNTYAVCMNAYLGEGVGASKSYNYNVLESLSTPIAYITSGIYPDAFQASSRISPNGQTTAAQIPFTQLAVSGNPNVKAYRSYQYTSTGSVDRAIATTYYGNIRATTYVLGSAGPDLMYLNMGGLIANNSGGPYFNEASYKAGNTTYAKSDDSATANGRTPEEKLAYCSLLQYDSTNGTRSFGEIYRAGGNINANYGQYFYRAIPR